MSINRFQRSRSSAPGMAGTRAVEELVARAPERFDITVIGGEPHPSCNRILLSSVLTDERTLAEIGIQPAVQVFGRRQSQNLRRTQAAGG